MLAVLFFHTVRHFRHQLPYNKIKGLKCIFEDIEKEHDKKIGSSYSSVIQLLRYDSLRLLHRRTNQIVNSCEMFKKLLK